MTSVLVAVALFPIPAYQLILPRFRGMLHFDMGIKGDSGLVRQTPGAAKWIAA
jgi:hypothetical protein